MRHIDISQVAVRKDCTAIDGRTTRDSHPDCRGDHSDCSVRVRAEAHITTLLNRMATVRQMRSAFG